MARETIRIEGLAGVLKTLQQLPPEMVSKRGGPVRSALRKAAKVIHTQQIANIQAIIDAPNKGGVDEVSTGLLKKSLVISRGQRPATGKGETVKIRVRRGRFYPASRAGKGKKLTAAKVGALLERGTERRPSYPWARAGFEAKKAEAVTVFAADLRARTDAIVRKLARQNRVKP